jgi:hypothetical protein
VRRALERLDAEAELGTTVVGRIRPAPEVAEEIAAALAADRPVLLANGPWGIGSTVGDPYLERALALLPDGLPPGIVVGGFHHAHALTLLAHRAPALRVHVAPPLAETLGAADGEAPARAALAEIDALGSPAERLLAVPSRAHLGYARQLGRAGHSLLPPDRALEPHTLRSGEVRGPLVAGHLLPLAMAISRWPAQLVDGAVLAIEVSGAQMKMLDRFLQRLALLGVFDRIGALLVGAPFELVPERPSLSLDEVVLRALGRSPCVAVADAFVGSGVPGTCMRLTAPVHVVAEASGVTLRATTVEHAAGSRS